MHDCFDEIADTLPPAQLLYRKDGEGHLSNCPSRSFFPEYNSSSLNNITRATFNYVDHQQQQAVHKAHVQMCAHEEGKDLKITLGESMGRLHKLNYFKKINDF